MIGEPFNEGAPSRPRKAKGRRPRDGRGVPPVASCLRKCRRATIYARTVPKGSPSEAVTISSPERRMYAHFLGRDRFACSGSLAPRGRLRGRRETARGPGRVPEAVNPSANAGAQSPASARRELATVPFLQSRRAEQRAAHPRAALAVNGDAHDHASVSGGSKSSVEPRLSVPDGSGRLLRGRSPASGQRR